MSVISAGMQSVTTIRRCDAANELPSCDGPGGGIDNGGFDDGLNGWTIDILGGSAPGRGEIFVTPAGRAQLLEGNSFLVSLQQTFLVPVAAATLEFTVYYDPGFDLGDDLLPDAFEAQLLDGNFNSVVPSWDPQATSYFNVQEDGTVHVGAATTYTPLNQAGRVVLDISGVAPGTEVTLFLDLIGADGDVESGVQVDDFVVTISNQPPVAVCRDITVPVDADCCATITPADIDGGSSDPDGPDDIVQRCILPDDGDGEGEPPCEPSVRLCGLGTYTLRLLVIDRFGARSTCEATVTLVDNTSPTIGCPLDIFVEHGNFLCDTEALDWLNSAQATDNCDPDVTITNDAPLCGFPYGSSTVVTWTATDDSGNSSSCSATITVAPAGRANVSEKGSLLIYPKVELRWNAQGQLTQDTFISLFNDGNQATRVQLYFVNGDAPLAANGGERAHPGWNWSDNQILLTHDEPAYWSVASGQPKGVSPFSVLDPGPPPGRPDGSGGRILRGFVIGWAINADGREIRWNHLSGSAMVMSYARSWAYEYAPWAYQTRCVEQGEQPLDCTLFDANGTCCTAQVIPGNLDLDGFQYDFNPERLNLDFFSVNATAYGGGSTLNTDLVLMPASADLRQDTIGPVKTKAHFDIWNQNEIRFSGTTRCISCWDSTLLSQYGPPGHFMRATLQTDKGKARIDGQASTVCPESVDAALLGIAVKIVRFTPDRAEFAGSPLVGQGQQSGRIQYDVIDGSGELIAPVKTDAAEDGFGP